MQRHKLFIVMPAFNEEANIKRIVEQWHPIIENIGADSRLLIVDDGSKDNTFMLLESLKTQFPFLIAIAKENSGHGPTCRYAFDHAMSHEADYIFQTDSDGQTNPEEFLNFWNNRNQYDFIIGYRNNRQDGIVRIGVAQVLKLLVLLVFSVNVKDCNTPFRLMKTEKLKPILALIPNDFFLVNVVVSMLAVKRREQLLWLPISFLPRKAGTNSINLKRIFQIGFKAITDFRIIKSNPNYHA